MICRKCGSYIDDGTKFCPHCGEAQASQPDGGQSAAYNQNNYQQGNYQQGEYQQNGYYGSQPPYQNGYNQGYNGYNQPAPSNTSATVALVFGIISLFAGFISPILAIVFGVDGMKKAQQMGGYGYSYAKAGKIMGIVSIVLRVIAAIIYVILIFVIGAGSLGSVDFSDFIEHSMMIASSLL